MDLYFQDTLQSHRDALGRLIQECFLQRITARQPHMPADLSRVLIHLRIMKLNPGSCGQSEIIQEPKFRGEKKLKRKIKKKARRWKPRVTSDCRTMIFVPISTSTLGSGKGSLEADAPDVLVLEVDGRILILGLGNHGWLLVQKHMFKGKSKKHQTWNPSKGRETDHPHHHHQHHVLPPRKIRSAHGGKCHKAMMVADTMLRQYFCWEPFPWEPMTIYGHLKPWCHVMAISWPCFLGTLSMRTLCQSHIRPFETLMSCHGHLCHVVAMFILILNMVHSKNKVAHEWTLHQ